MKYALIMSLIAAGAAAGVTANGEVEATAAQSCESLTSLTLPHTTITLARMVGPGGVHTADFDRGTGRLERRGDTAKRRKVAKPLRAEPLRHGWRP